MRPFSYAKAATLGDALAIPTNAQLIAGGTNILDLMKDDVERPARLIDINGLQLGAIEMRGPDLFIGTLARMSEVARHAEVRSRFPMVASALDQSASPQLRNMASMGGNLLQRTRCRYFRDVATHCNKRVPGSGCDALGGINRREAVLGTSDACIATHASDVAVALVALEANVHIRGAAGERQVPIDQFYRLPGATPQLETVLARGEMIVGMSIPALPYARRSIYLKVRDRAQYEFALTSAAVAIDTTGSLVRGVRIALGGVATIPWRSREAERALIGGPPSRDRFEQAANVALSGARGYGGNDFKIALAKRTIVRALEQVVAA